jgi:hypothetical protein
MNLQHERIAALCESLNLPFVAQGYGAATQHGVDLSVIALWLGHESPETTQIYLHADMRPKERALARANASGVAPTRYRPPDPLLAFLENL